MPSGPVHLVKHSDSTWTAWLLHLRVSPGSWYRAGDPPGEAQDSALRFGDAQVPGSVSSEVITRVVRVKDWVLLVLTT